MEEADWLIAINLFGLIFLFVGLVVSMKLYLFYRQNCIWWMMIAFIYSFIVRMLALYERMGYLADWPIRELAAGNYILFSLGIIGIYLATRRIFKK